MKIPAEIRVVARHLGALRDRAVFVGGMIRSILVTDPAAGPARPTKDVDLIMDVATRSDYTQLTDTLRASGFKECTDDGAPLCRWVVDDVVTDVMPVDPAILGFSNVWYEGARDQSAVVGDDEGAVRVLDAPRFCATKLEAHASRGGSDYYHHDIEDVIAVVDGRPDLITEIRRAPDEIREFLAQRASTLLGQAAFVESLSGHLQPDDASQARLPSVIEKLRAIAGMAAAPTVREAAAVPMASVPFVAPAAPPHTGALEHHFVRSSNLLRAWYDPMNRSLTIQLRNGRSYTYEAVAPELWAGLTQAYSAGRYFNLWIKRRHRSTRSR